MKKQNMFIKKLGCILIGGVLGINGLLMMPRPVNASQENVAV